MHKITKKKKKSKVIDITTKHLEVIIRKLNANEASSGNDSIIFGPNSIPI